MLTEAHIAKLWTYMGHVYGHRWLTNFGLTDSGVWLDWLRRLSPEQLAAGIARLKVRLDPWPPSAPEFLQLCLDIPGRDEAIESVFAGDDNPVANYLRGSVTSWDRQHLSERDVRARYRASYAACAQQVIEDQTEPAPMLEHDDARWLTDEML